ncbi:MAG: nucleoside triphosphate pyrophosphohydrolase [Gammaproteobacteria bacterium]|nr:nucleoside triphosphate pyrophosphohydrolase [Gammaproteobacteria bacterium]
MSKPTENDVMQALLQVMRRLRDPQNGCPWDKEQDFASIAPYTVEEAYEVEDAIQRQDMNGLQEELGDLLFQVVFHARMAEEAGHFDFEQVAQALVDKMVRRHPHVFGDADIDSSDAQTASWEAMKAEEKAARGQRGVLDDVPLNLPALVRAEKLSRRAGRVGFEWPDLEGVFDKIEEETAELKEAVAKGLDRDAAEDELGDMLFAMANLARYLKVDPEAALRRTNAKFERRFRAVEAELEARGKSPSESTLEEMDAIWNDIRAVDRRQHKSQETD